MIGSELLVAFAQGQTLGRLDEALGAVGVIVEVQWPSLLGTAVSPLAGATTPSFDGNRSQCGVGTR